MISCRSSLFLVADVLFGRVGTGGVESDEREIQERASEITGSLPLILIPTFVATHAPYEGQKGAAGVRENPPLA